MFLTLISICSSLFISGPAQQDSIVVYAYWKNHEIQKYETIRKTEKYNEDGSVTIDSMSSTDQVEIIDSTADTYTLKWTPLSRNYVDSGQYKKTGEIFYTLPVIYETTTIGNFTKLLNKEELSRYYLNLMSSIIDSMTTQAEKDSARKAIEPLINDNVIDNILSSVFRLIHQFYGYQYELNSEIEYQMAIPNPLLGETILANGTLYVSDIDTNYNSVEFSDFIEPDSASFKESIINYIKRLSNTVNLGNINIEEEVKNFEKTAINTITERDYNYNVYNGWLNYYYSEENSYVNGKLRKRVITYMQIL